MSAYTDHLASEIRAESAFATWARGNGWKVLEARCLDRIALLTRELDELLGRAS